VITSAGWERMTLSFTPGLSVAGAAGQEQPMPTFHAARPCTPSGRGDDAVSRMLSETPLADDVLESPRAHFHSVFVAHVRNEPSPAGARRVAP